MQDREREIDTVSARRPQPHTTFIFEVSNKICGQLAQL